MLHLQLAPSDLDRVQIAAAPAAVLELSNHARVEGFLGSADRREQARRRGLSPADLALFGHLFGAACSPGFLHPEAADPRAAIEAIVSTPPDVVRRDLGEMAAAGYPRRPWTTELARAGTSAARLRAQLASTLTGLLSLVVEPKLEQVQPLVEQRRRQLREIQRGRGVVALLNSLDGSIRFRPPVLEIDLSSGADVAAVSNGAGLMLVPSLASIPTVTVSSTGRPTVVTFSLIARQSPGCVVAPTRQLERLIGRSRSAVLAGLAAHPGVGTRELARLIDRSPASTSEHLAVLRANGLIDTVPVVAGASHHVTPLGLDLLRPD